jgi:hypothetical protein
LESYAKGLGEKKWKPIEQKLKDGELEWYSLKPELMIGSTAERA